MHARLDPCIMDDVKVGFTGRTDSCNVSLLYGFLSGLGNKMLLSEPSVSPGRKPTGCVHWNHD
jgi:hypothetical protein